MNMREKTEEKVFSFMEENQMISQGDKVVLGVSGGADSVCLLFLLLEYQKHVTFDMEVVHVNHGIREEAKNDASYVMSLCKKNNLTCHVINENVKKLASKEKISEELAGRQVRYEAFYQRAKENGAEIIAVAHHKNDNAETVLFHLFRGSGIAGLSGMSPMRAGEGNTRIVRPLLCLEREEIETYLRDRGISWRLDSTNASDEYTRNKIRHHILPYAEGEIVNGVVEHIHQSAMMLQETETYLEQQTAEAMKKVLLGPGRIDCASFDRLPTLLKKRVLFAMAKELSPTGKDITSVHVRDMLSLFEKKENRTIHLPFGIEVERRYGEVVLLKDGKTLYEEGQSSADFDYRVFPKPVNLKIPDNMYTKWFDYDKIKQSIQMRFRREGDYITIRDGDGKIKHKTLKQYMIDEKIPKQIRDEILLLAMEDHVIWVVGYRISEFFKISENTKTILEVKLIGSDRKGS